MKDQRFFILFINSENIKNKKTLVSPYFIFRVELNHAPQNTYAFSRIPPA